MDFQYVVLRYTHDTIRRERLNVGILIYSKESATLLFKIDVGSSRLAFAFPNFDMQEYGRLAEAVNKSSLEAELRLDVIIAGDGYVPRSVQTVAQWVVPLGSPCFSFGTPGTVTGEELYVEMEKLYQRLVAV